METKTRHVPITPSGGSGGYPSGAGEVGDDLHNFSGSTWSKKEDLMVEKNAQFIVRNGKMIGVIPQSGDMKIYKMTEVTYGNIGSLFNGKGL